VNKKILLVVTVFCLALAACSADKGKEQFDTAQFEEKQHNRDHAIQLYEEIVRKYPDSPYAAQARQRLAALKGGK
jgi:outer membrane protein assembly factor BamD (BamD/ComL family)